MLFNSLRFLVFFPLVVALYFAFIVVSRLCLYTSWGQPGGKLALVHQSFYYLPGEWFMAWG